MCKKLIMLLMCIFFIELNIFAAVDEPWRTHFKSNKNLIAALNYIKNVKVKDIETPGKTLTSLKWEIEPHLGCIQNNYKTTGVKGVVQDGPIPKYVTDEGKDDINFIDILIKAKKILDAWFPKPNGYKDLKDNLKDYKPILPPPLPPRDIPPVVDPATKELKNKLGLLKTKLSQLKTKLQLLSGKLGSLKEALFVLPDFENKKEWWDAAIAHPTKISDPYKDKIKKIWDKIKAKEVQISVTLLGDVTFSIATLYANKTLKNLKQNAKSELKKKIPPDDQTFIKNVADVNNNFENIPNATEAEIIVWISKDQEV